MAKYSQVQSVELKRPKDANKTKEGRSFRRRKNGIHWKVPSIMIASALIGVNFAVGHHAFYSHYNGKVANDEREQRFIIIAGTSFAFLVKMFLTIATGTAYVQNFWRSVKRLPNSIDHIDALYSVLRNPMSFWNLRIWGSHLLLAVLALVTWCIPIAAIVTPGTMTVQLQLQESSALTNPPQLPESWSGNQTYAASQIDDTVAWTSGGPTWCGQVVTGPKSELLRIALSSATQQSIIPATPPTQNSTYPITLFGPAIQCDVPSTANALAFNASLTEGYNDHSFFTHQEVYFVSNVSLKYNAWVPHEVSVPNGTSPGLFYNLSNPDWNNTTDIVTSPGTINGSTAGPVVNQPANQSAPAATDGSTLYMYMPSNAESMNMVLLTCKLHNASYSLEFHSENSDKSVRINSVVFNEYILPYGEWIDCNNPDYKSQSYNAMMWAFNMIMVGHGTFGDTYSEIMYSNTMVGATTLDQYINGAKPATNSAVKFEVEQLFQNMTVSMYSSNQFILPTNETPQVNTTIQASVSVFVYRPTYLYIAYGTSIACMLACVALGCAALLQNNCSYTDDFSTVLRTTMRQDLDAIVPDTVRGGADPLPKSLKEIRLKLITVGGVGGDGFALDQAKAVSTPNFAPDENVELNGGYSESIGSEYTHRRFSFETANATQGYFSVREAVDDQ